MDSAKEWHLQTVAAYWHTVVLKEERNWTTSDEKNLK